MGPNRRAQERNVVATNLLSRRELVSIGLALLVWIVRPRLAHAEPILFKVPISGGQEVPPVFAASGGIADISYDPTTRVLTWTVAYTGLSGPATMAHFHGPAQPGKNAPVLIWLAKQGLPLESPINGQATLTPDQARQFEAGEWYINIHTQAHPEGEIRGQVLTPMPSRADRKRRR